jgi:F0F1-type ATP synthase epsilon subunit
VRVLVNRAALKEELDVSELEGRRKKLLEEIDRETHEKKLEELEEELLLMDVQLEVARGN